MKIITLQREAVCTDCGAHLPAGARARYYSAERIYCESHDGPTEPKTEPKTEPLFPDDSIDPWIQCLEEVVASLTKLLNRLRRS